MQAQPTKAQKIVIASKASLSLHPNVRKHATSKNEEQINSHGWREDVGRVCASSTRPVAEMTGSPPWAPLSSIRSVVWKVTFTDDRSVCRDPKSEAVQLCSEAFVRSA